MTSDIQSEWILGYEEREPGAVAQDWVADNLDFVLQWVEGVTTADGREATEVLEEKYSN